MAAISNYYPKPKYSRLKSVQQHLSQYLLLYSFKLDCLGFDRRTFIIVIRLGALGALGLLSTLKPRTTQELAYG